MSVYLQCMFGAKVELMQLPPSRGEAEKQTQQTSKTRNRASLPKSLYTGFRGGNIHSVLRVKADATEPK